MQISKFPSRALNSIFLCFFLIFCHPQSGVSVAGDGIIPPESLCVLKKAAYSTAEENWINEELEFSGQVFAFLK